MKNVSYKDQLADARWQQKKYEILNRDNFTCQMCGSKHYLNVHHISYEKGKSAWEYSNENLITLCQHCHEKIHLDKNKSLLNGIKNGDWYFSNSGDFRNIGIVFDINVLKKNIFIFGSNEGSWGCAHIYSVSYKEFIKSWSKIDVFEVDDNEESYSNDSYFISGIVNAFNNLMNDDVSIFGYEGSFTLSYAKHFMPIFVQRTDFLKEYCDCNNIKYEY